MLRLNSELVYLTGNLILFYINSKVSTSTLLDSGNTFSGCVYTHILESID